MLFCLRHIILLYVVWKAILGIYIQKSKQFDNVVENIRDVQFFKTWTWWNIDLYFFSVYSNKFQISVCIYIYTDLSLSIYFLIYLLLWSDVDGIKTKFRVTFTKRILLENSIIYYVNRIYMKWKVDSNGVITIIIHGPSNNLLIKQGGRMLYTSCIVIWNQKQRGHKLQQKWGVLR